MYQEVVEPTEMFTFDPADELTGLTGVGPRDPDESIEEFALRIEASGFIVEFEDVVPRLNPAAARTRLTIFRQHPAPGDPWVHAQTS